ncbi:thiol oxidoreductase [Pseudoalteromonas sp. A25]|uniref:di-heme oxidoreductase family protein n=1 Tax=Pseudoalteromonas sp. A25 TaxID=116092 RepID=UPI001260BF34|nr:di-heme oxidoredictase family protein [Pseudoalteromonas sp. A25]BBN83443.1 thiol oxidoreductase [Pseudoalteromonas sp. A25]
MYVLRILAVAVLSSTAVVQSVLAQVSALTSFEKQAVPSFSEREQLPGGKATAKRVATRTFIHPAGNIPTIEQLDFWDGFSFFRDPWVASPAITSDRDGLGPLFNARSCKACHHDGGRGRLNNSGEFASPALLFRLLKRDGNGVDKHYGGQLQPNAVRLSHHKLPRPVKGEGRVRVNYQNISGRYPDGSEYRLRKPIYHLDKLEYGELEKNTVLSARYAPAIYGMGLLDAISEQDLLAQQDVDDIDGDGIRTQYNRVKNVQTGQIQIGRFGFKGLHPTLEQQVAGAFVNDMGITNAIFADEVCTDVQKMCAKAASVDPYGTLDIPKKLHDLTVYMNQTLGVPKARDLTSERAQQGRTIFFQLRCNSCHTPKYITRADYPIKALQSVHIYPYSDLALHDMGEQLADQGSENLAKGSQWRTPPLWGIGLQKRVQGFEAYLHDGRARTVEEAILWHGGEAQVIKQNFMQLSAKQRNALIYFLKQI